jgi:centriolar protein POC1
MLLTASDDKTVKIWALPTQRFMFTLSGHMNWVRTAEFSPDCRLAVSGGDDKTMRVWDIGSKQLLRLYDASQSVINSVAFHPDGTCIASAGTDKVIRIWDIRYCTLHSEATFMLHVSSCSCSMIVTHLRRSNQLIQSYAAHNGAVTRVAWHPSGNFLLTTSLDSTLKIWDVREGQLFYTLHGHEGAVYDCCFSPAGDFFASAGCDEQVRSVAARGFMHAARLRKGL